MVKPTVHLTKKDKSELGYISDSGFCNIFKLLNKIFLRESLDINTLNVHYFCNKRKYKNYYLVLTPEFEKSSFNYVRAKEMGFNIGKNTIAKMSSNKGSVPKANISYGAAVLNMNSDTSFSFVNSRNLDSSISLDEAQYKETWFLIDKKNYDKWLSV